MRISNLIIGGVLAFTLLSCSSQNEKNSVDSIGTTKDDTSEATDFCDDCNKKPVHEYRNALDSIPSQYINSDWMRVYADFIRDSIENHYAYERFAVCYIDNDSIPEICLSGTSYGDGALILTQNNGKCHYLRCYWSPYYIERKGLIDDGYAHSGTGGDNIVKLDKGVFSVLLQTESHLHDENMNDGEDYDNKYFVYMIDGVAVDTIIGKDADYDSSEALNKALQREYTSKGTSIAILDSPQGVYYTKTLLCELFCEGKEH